jgi:hypothetical protein
MGLSNEVFKLLPSFHHIYIFYIHIFRSGSTIYSSRFGYDYCLSLVEKLIVQISIRSLRE